MGLIEAVIAALVSLLLPFIDKGLRQLAERIGLIEPAKIETYSQKLGRLTDTLTKSSAEVDSILAELTQLAREREHTVRKLEGELLKLSEDEKQIKQRIEVLQNTPIPVAEHFAKLTESGEKRSARRDYLLFGAGVVVSTLVTILLSSLGIGG